MENIYLLGSEQVQSAGLQIDNAANTLLRAANIIAAENERQRLFLDDWLLRLVGAFEDHITILR